MYFAIKDVKSLPDFKLYLHFKNGEEKIFDMKPYLDIGIFKELKNESIFNSVRVSFDSIEWSNEADFDPAVLYKNSVSIK